jgi:hypothetical protein
MQSHVGDNAYLLSGQHIPFHWPVRAAEHLLRVRVILPQELPSELFHPSLLFFFFFFLHYDKRIYFFYEQY